MDPVSQAAVGAAAAQFKAHPQALLKAAAIGAVAGMTPDLDVLIRSSSDPLLELQYHRHFTHSLFFIPFGAAICALVLYPLLGKRWQLSPLTVYLWCLLGYGSHGLLDGCTTYGTQLLWPFSDYRVAWNTISVVDPLFTLPLIAGIVLAIKLQSRHWHLLGVSWGLLYLTAGWIQSERAETVGYALAKERGHTPVSLEAKPSFANIVVWKIVYEHDGHFYVDAVRPGFNQPRIWPGSSIKKLDIREQFPWLAEHSQQAQDIARFSHFSSGYVGIDPADQQSVVDIRYSMLPDEITPMWGIRLHPQREPEAHADYFVRRDAPPDGVSQLLAMIFR